MALEAPPNILDDEECVKCEEYQRDLQALRTEIEHIEEAVASTYTKLAAQNALLEKQSKSQPYEFLLSLQDKLKSLHKCPRCGGYPVANYQGGDPCWLCMLICELQGALNRGEGLETPKAKAKAPVGDDWAIDGSPDIDTSFSSADLKTLTPREAITTFVKAMKE